MKLGAGSRKTGFRRPLLRLSRPKNYIVLRVVAVGFKRRNGTPGQRECVAHTTPIRATDPHAYLAEPLDHLDLLANTRAQREEKAKRYESVRPGLRLGGLRLNAAYYLPELYAGVRVEPVPPVDRAALVDLVHERHRWFGCEATVELEVAPPHRAVVLVGQPPGDETFDRTVESALATLDPRLEPYLVGPRPEWLRHRFGADAGEDPRPWRPDEVVAIPAGRRRDRNALRLTAHRLRQRARR